VKDKHVGCFKNTALAELNHRFYML